MKLMTLAAAAALALIAAPALAAPKGCPPGLAKKSPACVPPGLAKKGVTAGDVADRRDDDRYDDDHHDRYRPEDYTRIREGDTIVLDGEEYRVVSVDGERIVLHRGDTRYRLPWPDDGSDYVRVGDSILRVDRKTKAFFEVVELADILLN